MSEESPSPSSASPMAAAARSTRDRLNTKDWLEIVSLARDGIAVRKIAKEYKVKPSSIYRGLKRRGVVIGSGLTSAATEVDAKLREQRIGQIREAKEQNLAFTKAIKLRTIKLVNDADKSAAAAGTTGAGTYAAIAEDLQALAQAMKIIRGATDNEWKVLGLDRADADTELELPELPIRELTDVEVEHIRDKQILEDDEFDEDDLDRLDEHPVSDEVIAEGEEEESSVATESV